MNRKFALQMFATGDNNDQPVRVYTKDFKNLLQAVFKKQSFFADFFGGGIEALDGIQHKDTAFSLKTSDIACVVRTGTVGQSGTPAYNEGENIAFGSGTGNSTRFGERTEIIYTDIDVPYTWDWVFHEGIDRHTVNNSFEAAIADRLELQARGKIGQFNAKHGAFISANAGKTVAGGAAVTAANVADVFNELHKHFVDIEAVGTFVAKVTPAVNNAIVDTGLTTSAKGSTVNIDRDTVTMFKGFVIEEIPTPLFATNTVVYAYIPGVGKAFTGIETARTIESEDFDGVALQGAGKAGEYILPDNKKAVAKVTVTGA